MWTEHEHDAQAEQALTAWIAKRIPGARELELSAFDRPSAGESSDTQLFSVHWRDAEGPQELRAVLRCAPRKQGPFPEYDLAAQYGIMRTLFEHSRVPVPEALWLEASTRPLGVPFLTMKAVDGVAPLDFPPYQTKDSEDLYARASATQRRRMWQTTIDAVAQLHTLDWRALEMDFVPGAREGEDPQGFALAYWRDFLDSWIKDDPSELIPIFDEAMDWLEAERPESERSSLCWGDAKLGNVLFDRESYEAVAVIDWELAMIGAPGSDLASLRVSDLRAQEGAGGVLAGTPSETELVEMYERASGRKVHHFHYDLVYAAFWRGAVALKVMRRMKAEGVAIDDSVFENHFSFRYLRELLASHG